jgi:hypothetical protein
MGRLTTSFVLMLVVAGIAFLSGGVAAVFIMLVIVIREGGRRLPGQRNTPLQTLTRTTRGASARSSSPVAHRDREDH